MKFLNAILIVFQQKFKFQNAASFRPRIQVKLRVFSSKFTFKTKLIHRTFTPIFQNIEIGLCDEMVVVSTILQ